MQTKHNLSEASQPVPTHLREREAMSPTAAAGSSLGAKILAFPTARALQRGRRGSGGPRGSDGSPEALHANPEPRAVGDRPFIVAWTLFAWSLAALRLRLAVMHHEVFGVDATLAFLVAAALPLLFVRTLLRPLRHAWRRWRA